MQTMTSGQTLHVLATDPGTMPDFKALVKSTGDSLVESKKNADDEFEFTLKKA